MYEIEAKRLKQNTEIMENTFKANDLKIMGFSVKAEEDGNCSFLIEISGGKIEECVSVKVNLYDSDGDIFDIKDVLVTESFGGYDALKLEFYDEKVFEKVVSARIYVVV